MKHFMLKTILLVSYFITFNAIGNNNEYILTTCSVNNNILKIISTKIKNQNFYTFELAGGDFHGGLKSSIGAGFCFAVCC